MSMTHLNSILTGVHRAYTVLLYKLKQLEVLSITATVMSQILKKILNHYWSAHDHCVRCCLRRKSVELHGSFEIILGWREEDY